MNDLIECKACKKPLACLAVACPSCGAPNDWVHPDLARFRTGKDATGISKPFTFTTTKTTIAGQTKAKAPLWAWFIAVAMWMASAFAFVTAGFFWMMAWSAGAAFVLLASRRADHFVADVVAKTWSSSNEKLWWPVRLALGL